MLQLPILRLFPSPCFRHKSWVSVIMKLLLAASMLLSLSRAQEEPQCSVYLAPSSTSTTEEPKWGIYAGTEIQKGEQVGIPEIAIQTLNIKGSHRSPDDSVSLAESTVEFFEQFIWVPDATAGKYDVSAGRLVAAVTGAGVLGAFNIKLTNAEWNHLSAHERPSMNESPGVAHVGRGAYTNFYNVALRSKDTILAGTEIFLDYGENWVSRLLDNHVLLELNSMKACSDITS